MRRKLGILLLLAVVCGALANAPLQAVDPCSFCLARCDRQLERCIASGEDPQYCYPPYFQCNNNCEANHCT